MKKQNSLPLVLLICASQLWGSCPTQDNQTFKQNTIIYYSLGNISGTEATQLQTALSDWSTADSGSNRSGVAFVQADSSHPATWTFNNGSTNTAVGASTTLTLNGSYVVSGATTIGINTLLSNGQPIFSPTQAGYSTVFTKVGLHELGHAFGLTDVTGSNQVAGQTVMNQISGTNDSGGMMATNVTTCDNQTVNSSPNYPPPPPTCCNGGVQCSSPHYQCDALCQCEYVSPIVIDVENEGFHLTSAQDGVRFDMGATGKKEQISWTDPRYHNAFLALDRNGDGVIESGKELFGDFTQQLPSKDPNGFRALAWFDLPENGGNDDGIIDNRDAVWGKLRLWIDANHDGVSQSNELHRLEEFGIHSIGLEYTETRRRDQFGNEFWFKGHINVNHDSEDDLDRIIYDVILVLEDHGRCGERARPADAVFGISPGVKSEP